MSKEAEAKEVRPPSTFERLASINVNEYVEKKNGLSYVSWAWAVDQLLRQDPTATWEYLFWQDKPYCPIGETAMVFCRVTAFGITRTSQLPVMNHRNQPIPTPNSFELNTAMQRCLAKAIALHGLALYVYAGEDTPLEYGNETNTDSTPVQQPKSIPAKAVAEPSPVAPKPVAKVQCLGENEIKTIRELAEKVGVNELVIAKAYKVETLADVPLAKASQIISKLQEKAAKAVTETETTE